MANKLKTYIFFREGMFYPVELYDDDAAIAEHARLNPGTLRVEDARGKVIWAPAKQ